MNIWRLITHHEDAADAMTWAQQNKRIAIGWGLIGDLTETNYQSAEEIAVAIRKNYPAISNPGDSSSSLWRFYSQMEPGDFVILSGTKPRELVVVVDGPYEWQPEEPALTGDYLHQRKIRVTGMDAETLWKKAGKKPEEGQSARHTLIRCAIQLDNITLEPLEAS